MCQTSKIGTFNIPLSKDKVLTTYFLKNFEKCCLSWGPCDHSYIFLYNVKLVWWSGSEPSHLCFHRLQFPEYVMLRTGVFFMLNKSTRQNNLPFFLNVITHKKDDKKKSVFAMFSSVTWLRFSACSRWVGAGLEHPFTNIISEKCN